MPSYDRALTIFSPDGHLFQVEYALEAINKGALAVGIRGAKSVIYAVEKKSTPKLQNRAFIHKICRLDERSAIAFAGLTADARVLIDRTRLDCQNYAYNNGSLASVDFVAHQVAREQQEFTQKGGRRPYGVSCLVGGYGFEGGPKLYLTEPSGAITEWAATAIGRGSKEARELLAERLAVKNKDGNGEYKNNEIGEEELKLLAVEALLEAVEGDEKVVEVAVLAEGGLVFAPEADVKALCAEATKRQKERKEKKKREGEQ